MTHLTERSQVHLCHTCTNQFSSFTPSRGASSARASRSRGCTFQPPTSPVAPPAPPAMPVSMRSLAAAALCTLGAAPGTCDAQFPPRPPPTNGRPVIGILSVPIDAGGCTTAFGDRVPAPAATAAAAAAGADHSDTITGVGDSAALTSCFDDVYVKWVEAAGARAVPVPFDSTPAELDHLFDGLNGLLFTGGGVDLSDLASPYLAAAGHLLNRTIDAAVSTGQRVPVWGSCMGIQTLTILVARDPSLLRTGYVGVDPVSLPLNLTAAAQSSLLFGSLPEFVVKAVSTQALTTNLHHDGFLPQTFSDNAHLAAFFDVLSTNEDIAGTPFVSTIEGKTMPVFGVQWHPERPQFEWHKVSPATGQDPVNHTATAVLAMQSFANFFVAEARRNDHAFATEDELVSRLIYNYKSVGTTDYQAYFFAPTNATAL